MMVLCMCVYVCECGRLKCVIRGFPTPQASWLIDHEPVVEEVVLSNRVTYGSYLDRNGDVITHLNLTHVTAQDGGEYTCTGKNSLGQVSHSAWLNVYGNPVAKSPKNITAVAGETLCFIVPPCQFR